MTNMDYRIENTGQKKLIGKRMKMSLANDKTWELWHSFMTRRKEIINAAGEDLFNVKFYDPNYLDRFNPDGEFDKMAAIEVTDIAAIPDGMESVTIPNGLYAVFTYKGAANEGAKAFQYIFGTWLPNSGYVLDNRPHFDLLGEKYKNDDPDSEEELWIPIKLKKDDEG
jgi:AraC family transcriptional regulator